MDRRVTWVHWWEANRDDYLMRALERDGRAQRKVPADPELLAKVVDALIESTRLDDTQEPALTRVRVASAMSLGKIGTDQAVDRLIELTTDPKQTVRTAAWLGLGVSGHDRARGELLEPTEPTDTPQTSGDRAARIVALGLLEPGDAQAIELLRGGLLDARLQEDQRLVLKSLRLLRAPDLGAISREVIRRTASVNVASEAILGMGVDPQPDDAERVLALLEGGRLVRDLGFSNNGLSSETCFAAAQVLDGYVGMIKEYRLRRVLTEYVFKSTPTGGGDYYRGAALLSLVPLAKREDRSVFEDALAGRTRVVVQKKRSEMGSRELPRERVISRQNDPIRGYAAIAMGMYLARFAEDLPQQSAVPAWYQQETESVNRRFLTLLDQTLSNRHELPDLRAAAAMGLAFSRHPDAVGLIAQALEKAQPDEIMVIGYGTLAMALRGDDRAAIPAGRYLKQLDKTRADARFNSDNATEDVLGLRAMALALGLVGGDQAASALSDAWATDPWLSLESAKALGWVEEDSLVEPLTASMLENPQEPEAVLAAMGLGEMLESARPSRFSRLSIGSNYSLGSVGRFTDRGQARGEETIRRLEQCPGLIVNALRRRDFQAPANVYLYEVLLDTRPAVGTQGD